MAPWPLVRRRPRGASEWLALYVAARLVATGIAAALLGWAGVGGMQAVLLLYGPASTAVLASSATIRRHPLAWAADFAATLGLVLASDDWRSPYYLMWLSSLALPAVHLTLRRAVWVALGATIIYLAVAVFGGPAPGRLQLISTETLAIHLSLPLLLTVALAYAADALRRLAKEQRTRERLAIEAERRRSDCPRRSPCRPRTKVGFRRGRSGPGQRRSCERDRESSHGHLHRVVARGSRRWEARAKGRRTPAVTRLT